MIKQFLKWLELMPLSKHNNEKFVYAFLDKVFTSRLVF